MRTSLYPFARTVAHTQPVRRIRHRAARWQRGAFRESPLRHAHDAPDPCACPCRAARTPQCRRPLVRGVIYGCDYRGQDVLAMVSAVPDSPWFMVSKVDVAEAFTDMRVREWLALSLPISLGLLIVGSFAVFWQRRAWRRERALKTELQRNMRWLESAQKAAAVGYFAYDAAKESFSCRAWPVPSLVFHCRPPCRDASGSACCTRRTRTDPGRACQRHGRAHRPAHPVPHPPRKRPACPLVEVWAEYDGHSDQSGQVRMIGTVQDITDRKQAEEKLATYRAALEAQVRQDPLTQVANRLALDEAVATEWSRALRSGAPLSVLMIDVDHFKAYNDHYGHVAGDLCLQRVAQALSLAVGRVGDLVARYGGEEFAVLLPDTDSAQATVIGQRLCAAVRALRIEHLAANDRLLVTRQHWRGQRPARLHRRTGPAPRGPSGIGPRRRAPPVRAGRLGTVLRQTVGRDQVVTFAPDADQAPVRTPAPSSNDVSGALADRNGGELR